MLPEARVDCGREFGRDLYAELAGAPASAVNLAFSPTSIVLALAMARVGARGTTAAEFDAVLHVTDGALFGRALSELAAELRSRERGDVVLTVANSAWVQSGFELEPAFVAEVDAQFNAGCNRVDFGATETARRTINSWVDGRTRGRIAEILRPGSLTPLTRLALVNAIYLKAAWQTPFPEHLTRDAPFTATDGSTREVPTMCLTEMFVHRDGAGAQVLGLPYISRELTMLIALPPAGGSLAAAVDELLIDAPFEVKRVSIALPSFRVDTAFDVASQLRAMGMPTAFDEIAADFSAMTSVEPLFIGAVAHQATVTVDEHGSEAAAATAVMMSARGAPIRDEPVPFTVDRPFAFAIRDNPTGAILFLGHIGDPSPPLS